MSVEIANYRNNRWIHKGDSSSNSSNSPPDSPTKTSPGIILGNYRQPNILPNQTKQIFIQQTQPDPLHNIALEVLKIYFDMVMSSSTLTPQLKTWNPDHLYIDVQDRAGRAQPVVLDLDWVAYCEKFSLHLHNTTKIRTPKETRNIVFAILNFATQLLVSSRKDNVDLALLLAAEKSQEVGKCPLVGNQLPYAPKDGKSGINGKLVAALSQSDAQVNEFVHNFLKGNTDFRSVVIAYCCALKTLPASFQESEPTAAQIQQAKVGFAVGSDGKPFNYKPVTSLMPLPPAVAPKPVIDPAIAARVEAANKKANDERLAKNMAIEVLNSLKKRATEHCVIVGFKPNEMVGDGLNGDISRGRLSPYNNPAYLKFAAESSDYSPRGYAYGVQCVNFVALMNSTPILPDEVKQLSSEVKAQGTRKLIELIIDPAQDWFFWFVMLTDARQRNPHLITGPANNGFMQQYRYQVNSMHLEERIRTIQRIINTPGSILNRYLNFVKVA